MKELFTGRFWREVKSTFDEARAESKPALAEPHVAPDRTSEPAADDLQPAAKVETDPTDWNLPA